MNETQILDHLRKFIEGGAIVKAIIPHQPIVEKDDDGTLLLTNLNVSYRGDAELAKSRARIAELEKLVDELFHHTPPTEAQRALIETVLP